MKKFLVYFFLFVFICFILPAILTKQTKPVATSKEETKIEQEKIITESSEEKQYDYKKYGTIRLLHKNTGQIEEVALDDYLCNVVSAEMPADFEVEALKTQVIVARTYTIYKAINKKHENADICDDSTCCQAWISKEERLARWEEDKRQSNWEKNSAMCKTNKWKNYYI